MWTDTEITKRFGIAYPIVQGPLGGGISSATLVAAVSNAGGLGSYGANNLPPAQIKEVAADIRALTNKPFAINLWVDEGKPPRPNRQVLAATLAWFAPYYRELGIEEPDLPASFGQDYNAQVEAVLAVKPRVFSFVFGIPSNEVLRACRAQSILTIGTATTVDEARALDEAGVSAIVASGFEAGGHRGSFLQPPEDCLMGTLALIPQVAEAVKTPIIAAGGIADARGIVAALALGAQAAQIGTAFAACEESGAPAAHRDKLFSDGAKDTVLSSVFSGRLARGMRNRLMEEMASRTAELLPYPAQSWFTGILRKAAIEQGRGDLISLQAGQATPLIRHRKAAALMAELVRQTPRVLARLSR
jgi:nitronate monooxygenase